MCGHVGVAGVITRNEMDAVKDLMIFTAIRGKDSFGASVMTDDGPKSLTTVKAVGSPFHWLEHKAAQNLMDKTSKRLFLGHCRAATVGQVNTANAHPFDLEHIVGAHNGTIPYPSRSRLTKASDYGTDSEALLRMIDQTSVTEAIKEIEGAWALVWYDKRTNEINFLRNKERTFYYTFTKDRSALFWCSEAGIMEAALFRNNVEHTPITLLAENTVVTHILPMKFNEVFGKAGRYKAEGKKPDPVTTYHGHNFRQSGRVIAYTRTGYNGRVLTRSNFEAMTKNGCAWCSTDIAFEDPCWFISHSEVLCDNCGKTNGGWLNAEYRPAPLTV